MSGMSKSELEALVIQLKNKIDTMEAIRGSTKSPPKQAPPANATHQITPHAKERSDQHTPLVKKNKIKIYKRKRKSGKTLELRRRFRSELMRRVDARYLACQNSYKLFKTTSLGDTIQVEKFMRITRPIIHEVCGERRHDTDFVKDLLRDMKKIVKKRRSFHVQSWRKTNTHANLRSELCVFPQRSH